MVVQHNLTAMNSNRMLGITTKTQAKSTEKLSSGYKINRAADDAAGLAISEKMRKQIRGLTQASLNAQDGISAVQTAEGALTEVHDMLQRMNELSIKSSNGTMSTDDRQKIQDEIDQLVDEIDRVSNTTKFNETYLLKGDADTTTFSVNVLYKEAGVPKFSASGAAFCANGKTQLNSHDDIARYVTFNEKTGKLEYKKGAMLYKVAAQDTTAGTQGGTKNEILQTDLNKYFKVEQVAVYTDKACTKLANTSDIKGTFKDDGTYTTGKLFYKDAAGKTAALGVDYMVQKGIVKIDEKAGDLTLSFQVGADTSTPNKISVALGAMSSAKLGISGLKGQGVSGKDSTNPDAAVNTIASAIDIVSRQRAALGAVQNRLEHTINNLDNIVENTTAAEAQIRDTDMATEMVKYSNNNILAQAGQAMLAQSNQSNQGVLSLLG